MLTNEEIQGYLARLGIREAQMPTKSFLFELHRAHVERIPWESVDIVAGSPASIDVKQSVQLMIGGRSGYCFHLNGAFSELLRSLGYRVSRHRAGVQRLGEAPVINSFHLGLTVTLQEDDQAEEKWIIDVGLGDLPYEPMPLVTGVYEQGPYTYKVMKSGVAENGWRVEHDAVASFSGVDFDPEVVGDLGIFDPKHEIYSRSAESPWINLFLVRQRHASGSNEVRGCIWSKRDLNGTVKTELETKSQWLEVLGDVFGERLVRYSSLERDELWKKVRDIHEQWKGSRE